MCVCFFLQGQPYLNALKQTILDEIRQSNGIKPQNDHLKKKIVSFSLRKEIFDGKWIWNICIPFTWNIKQIPSAHQFSTLYLKLSVTSFSHFHYCQYCNTFYISRQLFRTLLDRSWQFIKIHYNSWQWWPLWHIMTIQNDWLNFMTILDNSWQFMSIHNYAWQFMSILIDSWRFTMFYVDVVGHKLDMRSR